jgi:hypothetical protein
MKIKLKELMFLSGLKSIDSISTVNYSDEIHLHKGNKIGIYVPGQGVVLEPVYTEVSRCHDLLRDLVNVGIRKKGFLFYGAYSISKKEFVVPLIYTNHEFWAQFKAYIAVHHPTPPFRRIWG